MTINVVSDVKFPESNKRDLQLKMPETISLRDFKRLILMYHRRPFFMDFKPKGDESLLNYIKANKLDPNFIKVFFDLYNFRYTISELYDANKTVTVGPYNEKTGFR